MQRRLSLPQLKAIGKWCVGVLVFLFLQSCSSWLVPDVTTQLEHLREGQYELDAKHTAVLFKVRHMNFSKFVGRLEKVEASLNFVADNIEASRLQAIIDMSSVNVNNERFANTLKGSSWFDVERYPQAVFTTQSAVRKGENLVVFTGELKFLGTTQNIDLAVQFNGGANNLLSGRYTIGFEAHTVFSRAAFGLDKYPGVVGDEVEIEVHAEFMRIR